MNSEPRFPIDDPRLTAYALGELEGDERRAIDAWIRTDAEAQNAVAATQRFADQLEGALADEPIAGAATEIEIPSVPVQPATSTRFAWQLAVAAGLTVALAIGTVRQRRETLRLRELRAEAISVQSPMAAPLGLKPGAAPFEFSAAPMQRSFAPAMALGVRLNNNQDDNAPTSIEVLDKRQFTEASIPGPGTAQLSAAFATAMAVSEGSTLASAKNVPFGSMNVQGGDPDMVHDPHFSLDPKFVIKVNGDLDPFFLFPKRKTGANVLPQNRDNSWSWISQDVSLQGKSPIPTLEEVNSVLFALHPPLLDPSAARSLPGSGGSAHAAGAGSGTGK